MLFRREKLEVYLLNFPYTSHPITHTIQESHKKDAIGLDISYSQYNFSHL